MAQIENYNKNGKAGRDEEELDIKEIIKKIRLNLVPIILLFILAAIISVYYAINQPDIYKSSSLIRITKGSSNILEGPLIAEFGGGKNEHVQNEIEIMKIYSIRENVAEKLIDAYKTRGSKYFYLVKNEGELEQSTHTLKSKNQIISLLGNVVEISQKKDLEIVEISCESPSPFEAAIITNYYVQSYKEMNLKNNRQQLTAVKDFLKEQVNQKFNDLVNAERLLSEYQEKGGIVALDEQASQIITKLSDFEAQKQGLQLDLAISNKNLVLLKDQLKKQEPRLSEYIDNFQNQKYIEELISEIAKFEVNRDIALSASKNNNDNKTVIEGYNSRIAELRTVVDEKTALFTHGVFSTSKEEIKSLLNEILKEEINYQTLKASAVELDNIISNYETRFNKLPKQTFEYAKLERDRSVKEKLYLLVEEKFQEALVNEQAVPSNVIVLDEARIPGSPSGPNRIKIIMIGIMIGFGISFAFVFIKEFFNNKIESPEDIQKLGLRVLGWIPHLEIDPKKNDIRVNELIVKTRGSSTHAEAFRSIRTRLQVANNGNKTSIKSILVSSTTPQEGKTFISSNLAASFALSGLKTIIIDADLRKPRIHKLFDIKRVPGLTDYIMGVKELTEIVRETDMENLYVMTSGNIPSNPAEMLGSHEMQNLLLQLNDHYDRIIVDSPPIIAVADAEILSNLVSGTVLVVRSQKTDRDTLRKASEIINNEYTHFIGTVLNDFIMRKEYGSYYKYYYYYYSDSRTAKI